MRTNLFVSVFLFLLAIFPSVLSADRIIIAADPWMPYTGDGSPIEGYLIDIARSILNRHGHIVTYKVVSWSDALQETRAGTVQAAAGAYTTDAPDFVFPENELGVSIHRFYVRKEDPWRYKGLSSLEKRCLGAIKNYSYGDSLDGYILQNKGKVKRIYLVGGDKALPVLISQLLGKKIDVIIENNMVMEFHMSKSDKWKKIQDAGSDGNIYNVHIGFSPKNPKSKKYAKLLSDGIIEMRENGELQEILRKYGLVDWK